MPLPHYQRHVAKFQSRIHFSETLTARLKAWAALCSYSIVKPSLKIKNLRDGDSDLPPLEIAPGIRSTSTLIRGKHDSHSGCVSWCLALRGKLYPFFTAQQNRCCVLGSCDEKGTLCPQLLECQCLHEGQIGSISRSLPTSPCCKDRSVV